MKNIFIKTILFVVIVLGVYIKGNAQTNIKIMDLMIIPLVRQDSLMNDSIELMVHFKINKPSDASKVHFWLGSSRDNFDILSVTPIFTTNGNVSQLTYGGSTNEVINYLAAFTIKISKVYYTNTLKATLFVEAITGQFTNRLYY